MSKKKPHQQQKTDRPKLKSRSHRKVIVAMGLILCLGVLSVLLAKWRAARAVTRTNALLAMPTPTPSSFSPSNPSKAYIYAGGKLIATEEPVGNPSSNRINVALASNGGVASASSQLGTGWPAAGANNGERKGLNWGNGGGWADGTANTYPDWLQITFNGMKTIDEIDVFGVQDNYQSPSEPTETMTFSYYGLAGFNVQYWDGSAWVNVPGCNVGGNNLIWKKFIFSAITTNKVRVQVNNALYGNSRITEVEAYGTDAPARINVALTSNGGTVSVSSTGSTGGTFPASGVNNGDRKGLNWENGGGWRDGTDNVFPDWLQVDFNGTKTIDEIDVFTIQNGYANPSEPTETMTFSLYGITAFDVQYWNGSSWATVTNGSVSGNDKVWRKFTFSPVTTTKLRVVVNNALYSASRIIEVEAWGTN